MQRLVELLFLIAVFAGCNANPVKIAKDIIPKDSMIVIMVDMNTFDASNYPNEPITQNENKYDSIFNKHNITREQYVGTLKEYFKDTAEFRKMSDKVSEKMIEQMMEKF